MTLEGRLSMMDTIWKSPVEYFLPIGSQTIPLNRLIGEEISVRFCGYLQCVCGRRIAHGYFGTNLCYDCARSLPQAGASIIRPELSSAHLGIEDRDLEWEKEFQLAPHVVYLADSGGIKVGVTRQSRLPYRWIDQGASRAVVLARTENRFQAGVIEVELKRHFSDRTPWKRMLRNIRAEGEMSEYLEQARAFLRNDLKTFLVSQWQPTEILYPVEKYPEKIRSVSLHKEPSFRDMLCGIRGQYLIFESGKVWNVRSHENFCVEFSFPDKGSETLERK